MSVAADLDLDPDQISQRSAFLRSHARMLTGMREVGDSDAHPAPSRLMDLSAHGFRQEQVRRDIPRTGWDAVTRSDADTFHAVVASTYLQAAILDLVVGGDPVPALQLAGDRYLDAGLPFGAFLHAAADPSQPHQWATDVALESLTAPTGRRWPTGDYGEDALAHPVQLTYLCMAYSIWGAVSRWGQLTEHAAAVIERLRAHTLHPIGPQSTQIKTYLELAAGLLPGPRSSEESLNGVRQELQGLGAVHERSLRAAQQDEYHWKRLLSPTVLIDIDQVAVLRAIHHLATRRPEGGASWQDWIGDIPGPTVKAVDAWLG